MLGGKSRAPFYRLHRNGCVHSRAGKEASYEYLWSSFEQRLLQQGAPRGILTRGLLPLAASPPPGQCDWSYEILFKVVVKKRMMVE